MTVHELNRDQMRELKERYLIQLADSGEFSEIMDVDYDEPSLDDMARADEIVPDEVIFNNWEGVEFVPEDFFCGAEYQALPWWEKE